MVLVDAVCYLVDVTKVPMLVLAGKGDRDCPFSYSWVTACGWRDMNLGGADRSNNAEVLDHGGAKDAES
jgi:hypothetical protein